jgi:hypothetical protein
MLIVPIEARHSPIHGLGVFAREFIPQGTIIWQFDPGIDRRFPVDWVARQPAHVRAFMASYAVLNLDGQQYTLAGDHTLFVNHSPSPNMAPKPEVLVNGEEVVVATRDVQPGEELTIDYGTIDGADRDKLAWGVPLFPGSGAGG